MTREYSFLLGVSICLLVASCGKKAISSSILSQSTQIETTKKSSIVEKLKENAQLPVEERIALYYDLRKQDSAMYDFGNETELTLYGYSLLWNNNVKDAIAIFGLVIAEFPNSANAYDSMGEAYLVAGDSIRSLQFYERSLKMNPDNYHAEDVIQSIRYPQIKPLTAKQKFSKIYSKKEYIADLDQLGQKLLSVHPHPLKFISRDQFLRNIEIQKSLITDSTTYAEFAWQCNAIIASIGCSHTSASTLPTDYPIFSMLPVENSFPMQVRWVDSHLVVVNPMRNADRVSVKDEILSINGMESSKLMSDIFEHIVSQANIQTSKVNHFNTFFAALIPYALGLPSAFEIRVRNGNGEIQLHKARELAFELYDPSVTNCAKDLCLEILDKRTAVLTISSFNYYEWNNFPVFKSFLDSSMRVIENRKIQNLIIDVRHNSGGSQYPSIYLLQHLMNKPFTYYSKAEFAGKTDVLYGEETIYPLEKRFEGKVYFLMDGNGKSTTGHFMSVAKANKLGTIIGEELGSNQFCTAGQLLCRLSNTKLVVSIANNTHVSTATMFPEDRGILPDFFVNQGLGDYLNRVDAVKNYTLRLIRK
jgi:tetratricopeptide (TPR) repeat protein